MKKRVTLLVIYTISLFFLVQSALGKTTFAIKKAKMFEAQNLKNQRVFKQLMRDSVKRYKNNKKEFFTYQTQKNEDGLTALMIATVTFDRKQVRFLLEQEKEFYGAKKNAQDKQQIFDYLDTRDPDGNSAFFLAVLNRDYDTIKIMMELIPALLDYDKTLLLKLLTTKMYTDKWTPLHWLVYDGATRVIEYFVPIVEKILGKNSPEYQAFINAQNEDGGTPLNYAIKPNNRKFLIDHGARIITELSPQILEAYDLSRQVIEAMHEASFSKLQKIVYQVQEQYRSDPDLFYKFITAKDEAGWDILIHAVALGRYEYVAFILYVVERFFHNKQLYIYDVLRAVTTDGNTPLLIAILRRNFEIAKFLIDKIQQYSKNKYFFYMVMNSTAYRKGLTPLLASVFFGSDKDEFYDITKLILEVIAQRFGKNSHIMNLFVNTRNLDGFTALSYAASQKIIQLLEEYGAHE